MQLDVVMTHWRQKIGLKSKEVLNTTDVFDLDATKQSCFLEIVCLFVYILTLKCLVLTGKPETSDSA